MYERWWQIRLLVVGLLVAVAVVVWAGALSVVTAAPELLTVRFLDVGQGDSIHIVTPDGIEVLIDGGPTVAVLRELARGRSFFDRELDVIIATHPDSDHIAGLIDVLERYQVKWVVQSAVEGDTPAAARFQEKVRAEGAHLLIAQAGQTIALGASTTLRILSPHGNAANWETNSASVIVQLVHGDAEFMLTGDAPSGIEEYLVSTYGESLESKVLKLGHHGSKTSSSELFLQGVRPEYAVVSAGKDNRYGHPATEVVARAGEAGARIVSTAEVGTIIFKSDGTQVWLEE